MLREFRGFPLPAEEIYPSKPLLVASRLPEMHRCLTGPPKDVHPLAVRTPQSCPQKHHQLASEAKSKES